MRYDTLLFDADDTLLDFGQAERLAIAEVLVSSGLEASEENVRLYSEINDKLWKKLERGEIDRASLRTSRFRELCAALGYDGDPALMADAYPESLSTKSILIDGAYEVCAKLRESCRLYLVTNGFKYIQERRFGNSPLAALFEASFISEEIGHQKPSREYFDAVKEAIPGFCAESSLVIGDSLSSDIAGGIAAGIDVCWYNPKNKPAPQGMKINYTITDLKMLLPIVLG